VTEAPIPIAPTPLAARLRELAVREPDRPAVTDEHETVTRAELDRRTNRLGPAVRRTRCDGGLVRLDRAAERHPSPRGPGVNPGRSRASVRR
jgi:non-ribosomal peptide synthetase component E (peptide arylation enzyme)